MKLLDLTLDSPAENLALDEALLEQAEAGKIDDDVLRLWESRQTAVIIGRSSRIEDEVNLARCEQDGVLVLRRCSGGTSVVIGPGCLMYSVVLSYERNPALRMVDAAHKYVLGNVAEAVRRLLPLVALQGTSDLTLGDRKFSGNSLRCKRDHLLYHGTLLSDFPLDLISRYLKTPPRQPDYREQHEHRAFVVNLGLDRLQLRNALIDQWNAASELVDWPDSLTKELVELRYRRPAWHHRL
ncbi:MAG TPA: lipoate--protein ligase family protein [Pirellulaceae bacterium]|nr:lipoate--protein ligase family protein [Pirellulaceae bacterium]